MRTLRFGMRRILALGCLSAVAVVSSPAQTSHTMKSGKPASASHSKKKKPRKTSWRRRGQQKIDAQRARQIQEALIREHYLDGRPSGVWDDTTQKAMQKFQADNGWQSKTTPDARALIKLGLGPDHDHLLNPESAMTTAPTTSHPTATTPDPNKPQN
ncbi:MAG: peptidoglycan-binding protein [Acidobacteriia bacterium]|nr:peptidoglycan-binding protein [Terriglobia bacterium]